MRDAWMYRTAAWKQRRAEHLDDHPECTVCGENNPGNHLHHEGDPKEYRQSLAKFLKWPVVTLCQQCHSIHHKSSPRRQAWKQFVTEAISHD